MVHDEAFAAFQKAGPLERVATVVFLINTLPKAKKSLASDSPAGLKLYCISAISDSLNPERSGRPLPGG